MSTNITDLTAAICQRLELEPRLVARLDLTPSEAIATIYKTRDDGAKYVTEDGTEATETLTFKVTA